MFTKYFLVPYKQNQINQYLWSVNTKVMERFTLTQKQLELIERLGVFNERGGASPAEARILGLLLVCDITELTFEEIYQTLGISKSAASNAINRLLDTQRIEYITKPGDRKRYFRTHVYQWEQNFGENFKKIFLVNDLLKEVLEQRTRQTKEFNASLKNLINFISFMQTEMPLLFKKWKEKNK